MTAKQTAKQLIAYSGTHGTGKTTSATNKKLEIKFRRPDLSVISLCDLEAYCPYPINTPTTEQAQIWLFGNQITQELTALKRFDVVVADRTIIDVIAYTYVAGFHALAKGMIEYAAQHVPLYHEIHFKKIKYNNFCYADGIRDAENMAFRQEVEQAMLAFHAGLLKPDVFPGRVYYV